VLSIDADAARRQALRVALAQGEFDIDFSEAQTALEGAAQARAAAFDLILVSAAPADAMGGVSAMRRFERDAGAPRTPIIAVGGDGKAAAAAMEAGCDLHMPTPITGPGLLTALARALSRNSESLTQVA
jgi:CheY-like chemotaxis protein